MSIRASHLYWLQIALSLVSGTILLLSLTNLVPPMHTLSNAAFSAFGLGTSTTCAFFLALYEQKDRLFENERTRARFWREESAFWQDQSDRWQAEMRAAHPEEFELIDRLNARAAERRRRKDLN